MIENFDLTKTHNHSAVETSVERCGGSVTAVETAEFASKATEWHLVCEDTALLPRDCPNILSQVDASPRSDCPDW